MLASYDSSQHCCCDLFAFTVEISISPIGCREFKLWWPWSCGPWASAQGLLMATINIQVQSLVLLWVWLQFELVSDSDGPRNTVLMMPSTFFSRRRLRRDEKVGKYCVKWLPLIQRWQSECELCVGGERRGELVVWLVKFAWIRACVKPDCWITGIKKNASQTKRMHG